VFAQHARAHRPRLRCTRWYRKTEPTFSVAVDAQTVHVATDERVAEHVACAAVGPRVIAEALGVALPPEEFDVPPAREADIDVVLGPGVPVERRAPGLKVEEFALAVAEDPYAQGAALREVRVRCEVLDDPRPRPAARRRGSRRTWRDPDRKSVV
jgi:hypothetical protein